MTAIRTLFCATLTVIAISAVNVSAVNVHERETIAGESLSASYVRVCLDHRGTPDRRACRHNGRLDPQRTTVAMR